MEHFTLSFVLFTTIYINYCNRIGSAIHIDSHPKTFNDLTTKEINITCKADGPAFWTNAIFAIKIGKKGEPPMAVYNCKVLTTSPGIKSNIQAEVHSDDEVDGSYLRLRVQNPGVSDAGTYSCKAFYLDESIEMREETAEINVTINNDNVKEVVKNLMEKVSTLENVVNQQEKKINKLSEKENIRSGFLVGNSHNGVLNKGEVLKFQRVIQNIGSNFDSNTGIYTAPVDGLYAFHLYGMSFKSSGHREIQIRMMANNEVTATLLVEHSDNYDQSSVSSVVQLKKGDTVKCILFYVSHVGNRLHPFPYSGFSGYLIQSI